VKSGGCDPRVINNWEASVRRAFENIICTSTSISSARLVRYFFSRLDTPRILSCPLAGSIFYEFLAARRVRAAAAGVGVGGRQPGNNAMAWRSMVVDHPCESRVSHGGETRSFACQRRVANGKATRYGGGGPRDRPPLENPVRRVLGLNVSVPDAFWGTAPRSAISTDPPLVGTQLST
jgi:hypothetical protein